MRGLRASVGSSDIRVPIIEIRVPIIEIRVPIIEIRVPIIEIAGMRGLRASGGSSARPRKFSPRLPTAASTSRSHIGRSTQGAPPFALSAPLFVLSVPLFALSDASRSSHHPYPYSHYPYPFLSYPYTFLHHPYPYSHSAQLQGPWPQVAVRHVMCRPRRARHIAPGLAINRLAYDSSFSAVRAVVPEYSHPLWRLFVPLYSGYSYPYSGYSYLI
jgi:hypothetical protein